MMVFALEILHGCTTYFTLQLMNYFQLFRTSIIVSNMFSRSNS
uniref:Uncharacterized protein n=1 Tax=Arundo donax TaxID=35708 RepID=A0A0A9CAU1_ARUDO